MAYLGKNINMTLVLLIIGVVIALLGITVFFQLGLESTTTKFESTNENLTSCQVQVSNYKDRLSQAETKIDTTSQDIRRYDQLYETKVAELGDISDDLSTAQSNIKNLNLIKAGLENENRDLKSVKVNLEQDVTSLQTKNDDLANDVDRWKSKYNCCRNSATIQECTDSC